MSVKLRGQDTEDSDALGHIQRPPLHKFARSGDYGNFETARDAQRLLEDEASAMSEERLLQKQSLISRGLEGLRGNETVGNGLNAVLLVSGENDDLSGDFMAAVIVNGIVEFRHVKYFHFQSQRNLVAIF